MCKYTYTIYIWKNYVYGDDCGGRKQSFFTEPSPYSNAKFSELPKETWSILGQEYFP